MIAWLMARQRIKPKELEALREALKPKKTGKVAQGHTVTKPAQTHENERKYQRKRDKRVKSEELE